IPDPRGDSQYSAMLQMVRMDGQGLQTLYCFPAVSNGASSAQFQWSVDEKSIVVSVATEDPSATNTTSKIFLLNTASGAIRQLFLDQNDSTYQYLVTTWLDNTRFYITKAGTHPGGGVGATVYLVNANTATIATPGLQKVLSVPAQTFFTMDS